jgi:hypothetical protein
MVISSASADLSRCHTRVDAKKRSPSLPLLRHSRPGRASCCALTRRNQTNQGTLLRVIVLRAFSRALLQPLPQPLQMCWQNGLLTPSVVTAITCSTPSTAFSSLSLPPRTAAFSPPPGVIT